MRRIAGELDTMVFALGVLLLVMGTWMISRPAAFLLTGILLCVGGFAASRSSERAPEPRQDEVIDSEPAIDTTPMPEPASEPPPMPAPGAVS